MLDADGLHADTPPCWCGNAQLAPYSPDYARCTNCGTLVLRNPPTGTTHVVDETTSLYGLNYFNEHSQQLGFPTLADRAHLDLPERCTFWLRTLLNHRAPPARALEIGSASGAFVGLLTAAGFEATGLDLSPAVTAMARDAFEVPVLTGPIEEQAFEPSRFDVIAMMDVLEHLPDPIGTVRSCASALTPEGLLFVQTPRFDPTPSYEDLRSREDPFYMQFLKNRLDEHLFVLSEGAVRRMLARVGFEHVAFVPAIFSQYDMSFIASRVPIPAVSENEWRSALRRSRSGRIVEALIDARERGQNDLKALGNQIDEIERDRAARLEVIHMLQRETAAQQQQIGAQQQQLGAQQQQVRDLQREIDGIRGELAEVRQHGEELAREIGRLRIVEAERDEILRRLGFLARFFRARGSAA